MRSGHPDWEQAPAEVTGLLEAATREGGLFSRAPAIFAVLRGPDHVLEVANPAYHSVVGGRARIGSPLRELLPELAAQGYLDLLDNVYRTGEPYVAFGSKVLLESSDGGRVEERFFDFSYEPVLEPGTDGRVTGIVVVAVDVTDRERYEDLVRGQRELLEQVARATPLDEVLDGLVRVIERQSSDEVLGSVLLLDEDGVHLRHGAAPSLPDFYNAAIDGVAIGPNVGSCGTAAFRGEPVVVEDIASDPLWADYRELAAAARLRACWSFPMTRGDGSVLGTFAMYYREPHAPSEQDLSICALFARTAGLAIERHRADAVREAALVRATAAHAEAEQARHDLRFVLDASTQVTSAFEYPQSLERLARQAVPTLAQTCVVDVLEDHGFARVAVAHADPGERGLEQLLRQYPPLTGTDHPVVRVVASGRSEVVPRMSRERARAMSREDAHDEVLDRVGVTGYACVPLTARGRTFGALTLVGTATHPVDERIVTLAEELARRAALAVDNSRQYARRVRVARELQEGLLPPRLPDVPGVLLAAGYHPAGEGLEVGGDFYDVFALPGGRWALMVGDVSGRGPRAATTTGIVRHTARAVAPLLPDPVAVIEAVNEALLRAALDETFVTMAYGQLRPSPGGHGVTVDLLSAGHPAPLLRRADGGVSSLHLPGRLLGQLPTVGPESTTLHLASGDTLVFVTDGVLEARDPEGGFFDEQRLAAAVAHLPGSATPADVVASVDAAVTRFTCGTSQDDRAVLAVTAR